MNLVAKEYVACRSDLTGALVLSEFAGAAAELRGAYLVNPHDVDGLKEAITAAVNADDKTVRRRMARLRRQVARRDVFEWADGFLAALDGGSDLVDEVGDRPDDEVRLDGADAGLLGRRDAG